MTKPVMEKLLKAGEVAELLGVSVETVWDWAKDGTLPCVRLGATGRWMRFRPADVERWVMARRSA